MTLISLLLVLTIERLTTQSKYWQAELYLGRYQEWIKARNWIKESSSGWALFALIFIPSLLLFYIGQQIDNSLLSLIFNASLLMVCIGCPGLRATYKCFLQAANRGDLQACSMYADQLGHDENSIQSFGQNLVWLNYRHYAAVVIWFTVFGAAGAVAYTLARGFEERLTESEHELAAQAANIMKILDWVPVRVTALGFLLVGHFSNALPIWLGYLADTTIPAKTILAEVSKAAEDIEPDEFDCTEEPCTLVKLAKRNVMFILVVISLLTLTGWVA
jgi:AmpE protein